MYLSRVKFLGPTHEPDKTIKAVHRRDFAQPSGRQKKGTQPKSYSILFTNFCNTAFYDKYKNYPKKLVPIDNLHSCKVSKGRNLDCIGKEEGICGKIWLPSCACSLPPHLWVAEQQHCYRTRQLQSSWGT